MLISRCMLTKHQGRFMAVKILNENIKFCEICTKGLQKLNSKAKIF